MAKEAKDEKLGYLSRALEGVKAICLDSGRIYPIVWNGAECRGRSSRGSNSGDGESVRSSRIQSQEAIIGHDLPPALLEVTWAKPHIKF